MPAEYKRLETQLTIASELKDTLLSGTLLHELLLLVLETANIMNTGSYLANAPAFSVGVGWHLYFLSRES